MARSVRFGGQTLIRPGGASVIATTGLVPAGPVIGVVGIVGEADSGEPGQLITIDDPSLAKETFASGSLADAIGPLFNPSSDPQIPGGAGRIYAYKTNQSSKSGLQLNSPSVQYSSGGVAVGDNTFSSAVALFAQSDVGGILEILDLTAANNAGAIGRFEIAAVQSSTAVELQGLGAKILTNQAAGVKFRIFKPQLELQAQVFGAEGNQVSVALESGTAAGSKAVRFAKGTKTEQSGDLGGSPVMNVEYVGNLALNLLAQPTANAGSGNTKLDATLSAFSPNSLADKFMQVTIAGTVNLRKVKKHEESLGVDTLTPFSNFSGAVDGLLVDIKDGVVFSGTATAGTSTTLTIAGTNDLGVNDLQKLVLKITDGTGAGQRRKIASNTATVITVADAFETTPDATSIFEIHYISDAQMSIYGSAGKAKKFSAYARTNGHSESDVLHIAISETKTLQQLADDISSSGKYQVSIADGLSTDTLAMHLDYGPASGNFGIDIRNDISDSASSRLLMDVKDILDWVGDNSSLAAASRSSEGGSALVQSGLVVTNVNATDVAVTEGWIQIGSKIQYFAGTAGFTLTNPGVEDRELFLDNTGTLKTNINVGATPAVKLADIAALAVPTANAYRGLVDTFAPMSCQVGGATPSNIADTFFGSQILHGSTDLSPAFPKADSGSTTTLVDSSAAFPASGFVNKVIEFTSGPGAGQKRRITANTGTGITFSPALSSAVTSSTAYRIIDQAIRGVSSNTDWQAGFDALLKVRVNHVVPLVDQDLSEEGLGSSATISSIHQQAKDHVLTAAGAAKSERNAYLSLRGSKSELIAKAANLNDRNITLVGVQQPDLLDVDGALKQFPSWGMACIAAGMRSGAEIGQPLTNKFINVAGLDQDSSWDPRDLTDGNELILGGVMFAEQVPGSGFRFVRDMTTYLSSDLVTFFQDSGSTSVNHVTYETRAQLEQKFVGAKAVPAPAGITNSIAIIASVDNVKSAVDAILNGFRLQNIIVDQVNADGSITLGYDPKKTRVQITGNICRITYEIFVVSGLDFITVSEFIQLPATGT